MTTKTKHMPSDREIEALDKALVALLEGYPAHFADGYIGVQNPNATAERIALSGVDPYLVIDLRQLREALTATSQSRAPDQSERIAKLEAALAEARKVIEPFANEAPRYDEIPGVLLIHHAYPVNAHKR